MPSKSIFFLFLIISMIHLSSPRSMRFALNALRMSKHPKISGGAGGLILGFLIDFVGDLIKGLAEKENRELLKDFFPIHVVVDDKEISVHLDEFKVDILFPKLLLCLTRRRLLLTKFVFMVLMGRQNEFRKKRSNLHCCFCIHHTTLAN